MIGVLRYRDTCRVCGIQVLSNGSLAVRKVFVEDAGKYGCMAGNNGGLEREEAYLHVLSGMTSRRSVTPCSAFMQVYAALYT